MGIKVKIISRASYTARVHAAAFSAGQCGNVGHVRDVYCSATLSYCSMYYQQTP